MRNLYQEQLWNLNQELIQMGAACEEIIALAAQSLTAYSDELEEKTAQVGSVIDESERTIENICLKLLLRQQPVARDLRQISAAMKMITDMERIGDQAEDIVARIPKMSCSAEESQLQDMAQYALDLLMIAKYFERIGDHCTNIAEWVEFSLTGIREECQ